MQNKLLTSHSKLCKFLYESKTLDNFFCSLYWMSLHIMKGTRLINTSNKVMLISDVFKKVKYWLILFYGHCWFDQFCFILIVVIISNSNYEPDLIIGCVVSSKIACYHNQCLISIEKIIYRYLLLYK